MLRSLCTIGALGVIASAIVAGAVAASPAAAQETVTVPVGDIYFCDPSFQNGNCETTVSAGDTVVWDFSGASLPHTTTSTDGLWDSDIINDGSTFQFTFNEAGTFAYQCNVHPTQMTGTIIVEQAQEPPDDGAEPTEPAATEAASGTDGGVDATTAPTTIAPAGTGESDDGGSSTGWWVFAAIAAAAVAVIGGGALAYRRAR